MKRFITIVLALMISLLCLPSNTAAPEKQEQEIPSPEPTVFLVLSTPEPTPTLIVEVEEVVEEPEVDPLATQRAEYPEATYVWEYLKNYGYNDYVCAGIIGNIMVECGGLTLAIQPEIYSKSHYGMCQWSKKYYKDAIGLPFEEQCVYLTNNIEQEFKMFGKLYKKGFTYEDFISMTNCRDAALAFAKSYERCGDGGYERRQNCAEVAYNYFTN